MKLPKMPSPLKLFSPAPAQPAFGVAGTGGSMMFASGRGGGGGDHDPDDFDQYDAHENEPAPPQRRPRATRASSGGGDTTGGRPRTSQFQPEERFWTDYLRIALPVIGLLLLIGLLWFWADKLINDDSPTTEAVSTETIGQVTTSTPTIPVSTQPVVVATPPSNTSSTTTQGNETATTPPAETTSPGGDNQAENPPPATEPPTDEEDTSGAKFSDGDTVVVTEQVNLRPNPTTEGDPIEVLAANTELTITGGPQEGDNYTWWEVVVSDSGTSGWVAEGDYLELAQ